MTGPRYNLLTEPLISAMPCGSLNLPGLVAALARDEVDSFPALRPHQGPAWHMFLVQLMALALHRAGQTRISEDEASAAALLRGLTPNFPDDEPWCLSVDDPTMPAFLQPPVPPGVKLATAVATPDALDLLITAKNHDLKQAMARWSAPEDWLYALVSLQTCDGYSGRGNYGVARMNGGNSSRVLLTLAPLEGESGRAMTLRPGPWLVRNVARMLETRSSQVGTHQHLGYPVSGGLALNWTVPWPDGHRLRLSDLDIWFIESCRRIRLKSDGAALVGMRGASKSERIDAKAQKGNLGDPFAPIHKTENQSLTLGQRDFDYHMMVEVLFSGNWTLPVTAIPASFETGGQTREKIFYRVNSASIGNWSEFVNLCGSFPLVEDERWWLHDLHHLVPCCGEPGGM